MAMLPAKQVKQYSVPGTTNANGNFNTGKTLNDGTLTTIWAETASTPSYVCIPILVGTSWWVHIRYCTASFPVASGESVTVGFLLE